MIKAIIFDCFGVLTQDTWLKYRAEFFAHDEKLLAQANEVNRLFNAGLKSFKDFINEVADLAGQDRRTTFDRIDHTPPNIELLDFIRSELHPTYKIGMLSNVGENWLGDIFSEHHLEVFDKVSLSFETGFVKPAREAYLDILEKLDVKPGEALYIEDQPAYVEAAKQLGITTIQFKSTAQAISEIKTLLSINA